MTTPARASTPLVPSENPLASSRSQVTFDRTEGRPGELRSGEYIHYGKYRIEGIIGRGSFATVYGAEHVALRRKVAIKIVHVTPHTSPAIVQRFQEEARIAALVRHPNVLETYDTGMLPGGSPFLVIERIEGATLTTLLERGPLPIATVVEIGRQAASGLTAIASAGVVHRDIKPDNVMVQWHSDGSASVKIVDFGVSKRPSSPPIAGALRGELIGTPQYMSPEQLRGEDVDMRADVYALGAVLYEALTGRAPHIGPTFGDLMAAVLSDEVPRPRTLRSDCPAELEIVLLKALARQRQERFESPEELLAALDDVAEAMATSQLRAVPVAERERERRPEPPSAPYAPPNAAKPEPAQSEPAVRELSVRQVSASAPIFGTPVASAPAVSTPLPSAPAVSTPPPSALTASAPLHTPTIVPSPPSAPIVSAPIVNEPPVSEMVVSEPLLGEPPVPPQAASHWVSQVPTMRPPSRPRQDTPATALGPDSFYEDDEALPNAWSPKKAYGHAALGAAGLAAMFALAWALWPEPSTHVERATHPAEERAEVEPSATAEHGAHEASARESAVAAATLTAPKLAARGASEPAAREHSGRAKPASRAQVEERNVPAMRATRVAEQPHASARRARASKAQEEPARASESRRSASSTNPAAVTSDATRTEREQAMRAALSALANGRIPQAAANYRRAAEIDPNHAAAYRGLALATARLGQRAEAERALATYRKLAPGAADADTIAARIAETE